MHVAVGAFRQKLPQARRRLRDRIGTGDADDIEAVVARRLGERGFQCCRIAQKSRSA
jgi:hypothetical protein